MKLLEKYADEFKHLNNKALAPILQNVEVFDIELDSPKTVDPKNTIFVGHKTGVGQIVAKMSEMGIEHFVQIDREGFFYDLFAASVMLQKPAAFIKTKRQR